MALTPAEHESIDDLIVVEYTNINAHTFAAYGTWSNSGLLKKKTGQPDTTGYTYIGNLISYGGASAIVVNSANPSNGVLVALNPTDVSVSIDAESCVIRTVWIKK